MRILHLTPWWPSGPEDHAGSFVVDQIEALRSAGHELKVNRVEGDRWTGVVGGLLSPLRWAIEHRAWSHVVEAFRPELIHAHVTWPTGWMAVQLGREWRLPVVISEYLVPFRSCVKTPLHRMLVRAALDGASRVTACGPGLANQMRCYTDREIDVVSPIVADEFRGVSRSLVQSKLIACVGSLTRRKDFGLALEVLRRLPDHRMVIVGRGELDTYLMQRASVLGVRDQVHFVPWGTRKSLAHLMSIASCVLVTSRDEGFSLVAAEALVAGVPVVTTACGGPEYFVSRRRVSWTRNAGELAEMILDLERAPWPIENVTFTAADYLQRIGDVYRAAHRTMPALVEAMGVA